MAKAPKTLRFDWLVVTIAGMIAFFSAACLHAQSNDPVIFRPPPRAAGFSNTETSPIAQSTWTSPSSSPSVDMAVHQQATSAPAPLWSDSPEDGRKDLRKPSSGWSSTISVLLSLLLVLALFLGVAWFFKGISPNPSRGLSKDVVQVLGRIPLAPRQQMILLRFGRKLVLISQQLGQTQTLSEIDDPTEVDHLLGLCEQSQTSSISQSFRDVLYQFANGKTSDESTTSKKNRTRFQEA